MMESTELMTQSPHITGLRATYRWQFHKGFTFRDATALVPYLRELGISHVYASPIFRASPGSLHGYDICDHNELNPEIGTRDEFDDLVGALHRHGMKLIVDFVPNHMGISEPDNQWWMDVLENGPASPYARYFDVEWRPQKRELEGRVLLPILGDQYGRVLERGDIKLAFAGGTFTLQCPGATLPVAARTIRPLLLRAVALLPEAPDELLSIITALDNLPARDQTDPDKITERTREKRIIRDRLARLCETEPAVLGAIEGAVAEWQKTGDPESLNRLDALVTAQPYRLSYWRVAAEEINYRRFFDVNSLAAICIELPEVFEATHRLLLELFRSGSLDGVRIDHIDGLARPATYLESLSAAVRAARGGDEPGPSWVLVEKILGPGERLRGDWETSGTTGYEFAAQVMDVLVHRSAERKLTQCYEKFVNDHMDFREIVYQSKRLITQLTMASEVNVLGTLLSRLAESHRWYRDFTVNALTRAVREVIACFPVYRSYIAPEEPASEADVQVVTQAISQARRRNPALERSMFDFLRLVLLPSEGGTHAVDEELRRSFVIKFQQCTGPIMAKGVEDTAFYVYNRLVALNEVGGHPGVFGGPRSAFHQQCATRLAEWPLAMLATSTHDTKRAEDVRARILAISEMPVEWALAVRKWQTANRKHKEAVDGSHAPDANEEYFLYQTLLGSWPLHPMKPGERAVYIKRIQDYMTKSLHEAKVNSSWIDPNEAWDRAVAAFVEHILTPGPKNRFLPSFEPFAREIAVLGMVNSLAQTVLKLTTPGVPDFYQGTEMWDFSLVDPDNRRPVDYQQRQEALQRLSEPREMLGHWRDGRIKLFLIQRLLQLRRENPSLFTAGSYEPLTASGTRAEHCLAFRREREGVSMVVVVPRLSRTLGVPPVGGCWRDTVLAAPPDSGLPWRNVLTGAEVEPAAALPLNQVLADLPVAVLVAARSS